MPPAARLPVLSVLIALVLAAFLWPSARLEPRGLPIGVVGAVPAALDRGDRFDVHAYGSPAEARDAVMEREVYGALAGRTVLVATGAGPAVATALRELAPGARVVDLAPGTRRDPRVATLPALTLPLTLIGMIAAVLAVFTARGFGERLGLIAGAGVVAGLLAALVSHTWLDALPGSWLATAGTVALGVVAVGATVTGLATVLGRPGIGVGATLMMLVANPWSGVASAPELLPEPAGTIGQLLPVGAAGNLLRSVAFFDGAAAGPFLVVLAAWILAGAALMATTLRRDRAAAPRAVPVHA